MLVANWDLEAGGQVGALAVYMVVKGEVGALVADWDLQSGGQVGALAGSTIIQRRGWIGI